MKKGDIVELSAEGRRSFNYMPFKSYAVVLGSSRKYKDCVRIKWNHLKTIWVIHKTFLETSQKQGKRTNNRGRE